MLVLMSIVYIPPLSVIAAMIILLPLFHILFKRIGYRLGMDKEKW